MNDSEEPGEEDIEEKEGFKQKWKNLSKRKKVLAIAIVAILLATGLFVFYQNLGEEEHPVMPPQIVFDAGHGQTWSVHDTGLMGYSILASELMDDGYRVSETTRSLDWVIEQMSPGDILVLPPGRRGHYSANEIEAILDFVERGGGLWVKTEWGNVFGMASFQNRLMEHFGVSNLFDEPVLVDHGGPSVDWINVDVVGFSAKNVAFYSAGLLEIWDGYEDNVDVVVTSTSDSNRPGVPLGLKTTRGNGRVMITSDSHFLTNTGKGVYTVNYGDNLLFAKEVFQWLSGTEFQKSLTVDYGLVTGPTAEIRVLADPETMINAEISGGNVNKASQTTPSSGLTIWNVEIQTDGYVDFKAPGYIERVFLLARPDDVVSRVMFDGSHNTLRMDDTPDGLLSLAKSLRDNGTMVFSKQKDIDYGSYDAVIFANPRSRYGSSALEAASKAKYSIFLGDYCGRIDPETGAGQTMMTFLSEEEHSPSHPLNALSSRKGVKITSYMVHDNTSYTDKLWNPVIETHYGSIQILKGVVVEGDGEIFAWGSNTSWGELAWEGMRSPTDGIPNPEDAEVLNTTVGIKGSDFLVFGDVQPFTNQHYMETLGSEILGEIIAEALNEL